MDNTDENKKYELDEMEQLYQIFQKACKLFQSDFVKFSGIATVGITIALWAIRSLGYCYQLGKFAVYGIDKCYVDVMSGNFILNIVQTVAICIVFFAINYLYFKLSIPKGKSKLQIKRRLKKFTFVVVEVAVLFGWMMFSEWISPIDIWKELMSTPAAQIISFGIVIFLVLLMLNSLGIQANWFRKWSARQEKKNRSKQEDGTCKIPERTDVENKGKKKGKARKEQERKEREREEHKKYRKWFTMLWTALIFFSIELALMYGLGRYEESCRVEYKVYVEDAEMGGNSKYIFVNDKNNNSAHMIYPVAYENQDIYILTRLYKNEDKISIDYSYQRIVDKEDIEVQQLSDIKYIEFE